MKGAFSLRVFEHPDAADGRVRPAVTRLLRSLDDESPAILVERHRDRRGDQWLRGDQFQAKAGLYAEADQRIRGGRRCNAGRGIRLGLSFG